MGNDCLYKKEKIRREKRKQEIRKEKDSILILCEGTKTETNYFNGFKRDFRLTNVEIIGLGINTDSLVEEAIKNKDNFDQIWCVFDRDSFPLQNFNRALQLADNYENIKIAYSNQSFELWFLLHFHLRTTAMHRDEYKSKLSKCLGHEYNKISNNMYELLIDKQVNAIKNARRLMEDYSSPNPVDDNPSTTVYKLVEELNNYRK